MYGPLEELREQGKVAERVAVLDALWGTRLLVEPGAGDRIVVSIERNAEMLIEVMNGLKDEDLEKSPELIIAAAQRVLPVVIDHSSEGALKFRKNYSFASKFFY